MKKILRVKGKGKAKLGSQEKQMAGDLQTRVELIQALIPIGLEAAEKRYDR